jgi:heat shock protein HtpX
MASYFDEIAKNNLKSLLLFVIFGALFAFIVYIFVLILGGGLIAFIIGVIIIVIYAVIVYFIGDKVVLRASNAKEADRNQYKTLYDIVEGLAAANEIPPPKVYIIDDPNPNAFATGKNRKASSIVVTTGLLNTMDKNELEGVLAHETSHILENDIKVMMIAVVFAGAIGLIAAFLRLSFLFGGMGGRGRNGGLLLIIGLIVGLLAPFFALLIRLAISRRREYIADANGARIIRNPGALASALQKIKDYSASPKATPVKHANEITANLYFSNPFNAKSMLNIFSTHPPIDERIKRLKAMY